MSSWLQRVGFGTATCDMRKRSCEHWPPFPVASEAEGRQE